MAESYYARRSAGDPAWREQQLAGAREREAARRAADAEAFRPRHRANARRCRERQMASGLTFAQLLVRSPSANAERLRRVLREEVARGTIDYHPTTCRYQLNGRLPADVIEALRDLALPDVDAAAAASRPRRRESAGAIAAAWPRGLPERAVPGLR